MKPKGVAWARHGTLGIWRLLACALLTGLAGVATPAEARAQARGIEPGRTLEDTLSSADPIPSQRGPFKVYQFRARKGDRFTATMRSTEVDAYLRLGREVGGVTDELASDDDGAGDGDARLRFTVPEDGLYLLIAQALEEDGAGAFTLSLDAAPLPSTDAPRPIALGQSADGELTDTDAVQDDDGSFYDTWALDARKGQRLIVSLESGAFDAFVSIGQREADGTFTSIASNDDGDQPGDTTNARMRVHIPAGGTYEIRANSIGVATGPYRLSVVEGPAPPSTASRQPIEAGEEVRGRLDEADAVLDDESYYEYWLIDARRGDRLKIRMASPDFDTFVAFGRLAGETLQEIQSNDDSPDSTDAELEVTAPRDGRYAIRAGTLGAGRTGTYTLTVTRTR